MKPDDDSDSAMWADWKKRGQEKRLSNKQSSTDMLTAATIIYTSHNNGVHLVVSVRGGVVDFWPSTGLWCDRRNGKQRRGVMGLIKYAKGLQESKTVL